MAEAATYCSNCGAKFSEGARFCKKCGAPRTDIPTLDPAESAINDNAGSGKALTVQISDFVLAKSADGRKVWINKTTGEIRTTRPGLEEPTSQPQQPYPSDGGEDGDGSAGFSASKSEFVLAKGPDGNKVWIHKVTGQMKPFVAPEEQRAMAEFAREEQQKTQKVKSIVDNVANDLQKRLEQSVAAVAAQPAPLPQRERKRREFSDPIPEDAMVYVPPEGSLQEKFGKVERPVHIGAIEKAKSRSRSRKKSRSRSRRRRRKSRSKSRKRLGGFSSSAPVVDVNAMLPTGFSNDALNGSLSNTAAPTNRLLGRKVLQMPEKHIRALFGKGGSNLQHIERLSNASIKIQHAGKGAPFGLVTIGNNIAKAVGLIKETLENCGCHPGAIVDLEEAQAGSV